MPEVPVAVRPSGPIHLRHIEGLRALAAYVVFVNHVYAQVWLPEGGHFPPSFLAPFTYSLVAGHLAVTVFIVMSGFCLTLPVVKGNDTLRGGPKEFFKRRARRILPPYYAAVALCLVLIWTILGKATGTLWDVPIQVKGTSILSHLLLIQDLFGTSAINYVFWSIAVEWQIYLFFPALVWGWRRYGPTVVVTGALAIGYALRLGFASTRIARAAPHYLGFFALGMLAAYLARSPKPEYVRVREGLPWGWLALGGVLAACFASVYWGWALAVDRLAYIDFPIAVAAACVLVLTSGPQPSRVGRALSWGPIAFIGTFSYSIYLIHAPLLQIIWQYAMQPLNLSPVAMFVVFMGPGALVVLAASYGFFRVFEEPFMRTASARATARAEEVRARLTT